MASKRNHCGHFFSTRHRYSELQQFATIVVIVVIVVLVVAVVLNSALRSASNALFVPSALRKDESLNRSEAYGTPIRVPDRVWK